MKYVIFIICIFFSLFTASQKGNAADLEGGIFNPENYFFSRMTTLNTWVSTEVLNDPAVKIRELQKKLCEQSIEHPYASRQSERIIPNPGDEEDFGSTWPIIPAIQLPMLQFVHNLALSRPVRFLEIGSGNDFVLANLPYAMKGEIWSCERSLSMLKKLTQQFHHKMDPALKDRCSFNPINSDCFELLTKHPHLIGYFDVIYVQNVEHLFSIKKHEAFVTLVESLLAFGGQVFSSANSLINEYAYKGHPIFTTYQQMKKTEKYPLFLAVGHKFKAKIKVNGEKLTDGNVSIEPIAPGQKKEVTSAERPSDLGAWFDDARVPEDTKDGDIVDVIFVKTENWFTPQIYRDAYKDCKSLTVLDAFFIDKNGIRQNNYEQKLDIILAAAIIKKKPEETKASNR